MKFKSLLIVCCLLCGIAAASTAQASDIGEMETMSADSLPSKAKTYQGWRVHLHDLQVSKQTDDWVKISYVPINTGREDLRFGELHLPHLKSLVIAYDDHFHSSEFQALQDQIEHELMRADLTLLAGQVNERKEMKIKMQDQTPVLTSMLQEKGDTKNNKTEESFSLNIGSSEEGPYLDENSCPDLTIDTLKIVKESKRSIVLEYTISNHGKGPANLVGTKKGDNDNVAFKAHMSSSSRLHRGAIVLGGDFVKTPSKNEDGLLAPNESWTGTIKLDLSNMTRFTPVIILEIDPYQSIRECDERNNRNHIKLNRS